MQEIKRKLQEEKYLLHKLFDEQQAASIRHSLRRINRLLTSIEKTSGKYNKHLYQSALDVSSKIKVFRQNIFIKETFDELYKSIDRLVHIL